MIRTRNDSEIGIWSGGYLNEPEKREEKDKNALVIQVECVAPNAYLVEFWRRKE